jgi:hypothetical protein
MHVPSHHRPPHTGPHEQTAQTETNYKLLLNIRFHPLHLPHSTPECSSFLCPPLEVGSVRFSFCVRVPHYGHRTICQQRPRYVTQRLVFETGRVHAARGLH